MTAQTSSFTTASENRSWLTYAIVAVGAVIIAFTFLYRLDKVPLLWFDEGSHLHVAENLAENGVYADHSSEGDRYTGPVVALGPTVLVPIAGLFKVFGVNLFVARLVVVIYAFGTVALLFALCKNLADVRLAIVAVAILVVTPGLDMFTYARSVLGEVPGLFFIIAGLWLWLRREHPSIPTLIGVGVLFGLSCVTKNQYAIALLPALLLAWITEMVWYRKRGHLYFIIPGAIAGIFYFGWMFFVLYVLGSNVRDVTADMEILRSTMSYSFFIWNLGDAIEFLTDGGVYNTLFFPALLYGFALGLRRNEDGQRWGILTLLVLFATLFYLSSLAWPRYGFLAVSLAAPLVAKLLYDLSGGLQFSLASISQLVRGQEISGSTLANIAGIGLIVVVIGLPLFWQLRDTVTRRGHDDTLSMAEYLNEEVPEEAVIETYEQEFGILTDHNYHYMPQKTDIELTALWLENDQRPVENYDEVNYPIDADYVLVNTTDSISSAFYSPTRLEDYEAVATFNRFTLYQRRTANED